MSLKPMYDRIAVEPLEQEEKTSFGIFIPDTAKKSLCKARLLR